MFYLLSATNFQDSQNRTKQVLETRIVQIFATEQLEFLQTSQPAYAIGAVETAFGDLKREKVQI
jgi:hypothetical protein